MTQEHTQYYRVSPLWVDKIFQYSAYHIFIEAKSKVEAEFKLKTYINSAIIKDRCVYFDNIDIGTPLFVITNVTYAELNYSDFTLDKVNCLPRYKAVLI